MRAVGAACALVLAATPAGAQDNPLGNFFSHLFGGGQAAPPAPRPSDASPRRESSAPRRAHKRNPTREAREKVESHEPNVVVAPTTPPPNASQLVYVLGDSMAVSAADGMADDLSGHPEIGVVDRGRDASGLVRDDYFDWPKAARDLAAPTAAAPPPTKDAKDAKPATDKPAKIDAVVVMAGINDMQSMRDGKDYVEPLTDRWKAVYAERVQAVVAPFRAAHVPVVWVGLPPMRNDKVNAEMIALNQIFHDSAEAAGAKFLDIFDGFAAENGGFDAFGPNIDGQTVKLRGPDGIHFTAAGGKKLAHFIDAEVLAALGQGAPPPPGDIATLPPDAAKDDVNEQIRREANRPDKAAEPHADTPDPKPAPKPEAGAIASLVAKPVSPGAALVSPATGVGGEAEKMLRKGEPPAPQAGRADDFSR